MKSIWEIVRKITLASGFMAATALLLLFATSDDLANPKQWFVAGIATLYMFWFTAGNR